MNMIGTKNVDNKPNYISPYFSYGIGEYKITSLEIIEATTGAKKVVMKMEGRPIDDTSFTPVEGAQGKVNTVALSSYMNKSSSNFDTTLGHFNRKVAEIADTLDVRDEVDAIEASTLEEYVTKVTPILKNKFTNWCIATEQYMGTNAEGEPVVRNSLTIPLYAFVNKDAEKLTFDKTKTYHFKPVEATEEEPATDSGSAW